MIDYFNFHLLITFSASITIGILSGIGLVVHEFAEGVIAFSVLLEGNMSKKKAAWYAFFVAASFSLCFIYKKGLTPIYFENILIIFVGNVTYN